MKTTAIVPAAGEGRRLNPVRPKRSNGVKGRWRKPFLLLGNKPILARTLAQLQKSPYIDEIVLSVHKQDMERAKKLVRNFKISKVLKIAAGGATRFESVNNGLLHVNGKTDIVFIHDAARPFLSLEIISKTIKKAASSGGAVAAVPATSTVKSVNKKGIIAATLDRDKLWIAGTPQVFRRRLIVEAYEKAGKSGTRFFDDSVLVERLGAKVELVLDSYDNIKITTPKDLAVGEAILRTKKREATNEDRYGIRSASVYRRPQIGPGRR